MLLDINKVNAQSINLSIVTTLWCTGTLKSVFSQQVYTQILLEGKTESTVSSKQGERKSKPYAKKKRVAASTR